jgi:non-heme chloroperoxidase
MLDGAMRVLVLLIALASAIGAQQAPDASLHKVSLVRVADNVQLEVLDWGGVGRPIVLLAGLGNTAHVFDEFALRLTGNGRVIGITRRGFGSSSAPESGYSVDRLGDDVLAVVSELSLTKPVLVGHSIAGQELSYVATAAPDRVAGLIYLDAAYRYAYMENETPPDLQQFGPLPVPPVAPQPGPTDRASIDAYRTWSLRVLGYALPEAELRLTRVIGADGAIGSGRSSPAISKAILSGSRRFAGIRVPALAIFASPHGPGPWTAGGAADRAGLDAFAKFDQAVTELQAASFERGVAGSRVVRLPNAGHYVFLTNERQVVDEIRLFVGGLR